LDKILVGIDGSDHSKRALMEAVKLAKKFGSQVTVVNVFAPAPTPSAHEFSHRILEEAKTLLETEHIRYDLVAAVGTNPAKTITDMAKEGEFTLVVIGSRGVGAAHALVLGSVCNRISCDSPVNVLIVK